MDATELYQLIENSSLLTKDTLPKLKQLTEDYPYFHTAKILYLRNLAVLNAQNFASELERMSIYISDRKKLFTLIEGTQYGLKIKQKEKSLEKPDDSFSLIDSFLSFHNPSGEAPPLGSPILFRPSATDDYISWITSDETEENTDDSNSPKLRGQDLIDTFIKEDEQRMPGRRLQPNDADSLDYTPAIEQGTTPQDSYFTETLARIYIKQKRYEKALQIIKNLSLKYPKKNVYFADQIRFLEKLIINTKK
jgi:hypothetical protein